VTVYCEPTDDHVIPLLIPARKAAKMLCISQRYLYTLTNSRQIRAVRMGRKCLYRVADIQRFVDERSFGPAPDGS
jgi:excisionase family DNA binding protein